MLLLDIQGAELLAVEGLGDFVTRFNLVEVEASVEAMYDGAPLFGEIDRFLTSLGFERISDVPWHGNVLYRREPVAHPAPPVLVPHDASRLLHQQVELASMMRFSGKSNAQLAQDIFVLSECGLKRDGFFVEFGGADGISLSNTYLLEKEFGWRGIVAEPARCWHDAIRKNRSCIIEEKCVWKSSGTRLVFNETPTPELSTLAAFEDTDMHSAARKNGSRYEVETISLNDLLRMHDAPRFIDYLSIDTEGSELDILAAIDFDRYRIGVITCEHNYTENRVKIHSLLSAQGYVRKYPHLSQWDDWYVLAAG